MSEKTEKPTADKVASACPKCGSTERTAYFCKHVQPYLGEHDGKKFTHIIRRRTSCKDCGQHRIDREFVHRGPKNAPKK